jgi:serine/threonine-protein kinase
MLFAGFFLAHWTKLRLVDRERTLRVLRRALAHGYPGEIGPETGRLLAGVFAVGPRLGRGGMGEVYEATDTRTRERVAIKMLHPHLAMQPRSLRRFRREAAILQGLGSQHIVRIISVEHDESHPFNVLELLVGETLQARIQRAGALPDAGVARLARHLAAALDVAHEHGVVHRDLNPSNVFLCGAPDDFTVKVFDFSISKRADDEAGMTVDGALLGTPAYMAPEQAAGRPDDVTPRTDIYAMGLVLFTALTGRAPFEGSSLPSLLERIRTEAMLSVCPIRPDLDPSVDAVLSRATSKSPEARYATAGELATALVVALRHEAA